MSLVGNFSFGNYDRTAETSGAQEGGTAFLPRSHITDQDPVQEGHRQERRGSLARTLSRNRRPSTTSVHRPAANREETYATAHTHLSKGATPALEKTLDEVDLSKAGLERAESDSEAEREKEQQVQTDKAINELARSLSRQSTWSNIPGNPFEAAADSELDP